MSVTALLTVIAAHPRVGGENCFSLVFSLFFTGSSPRGRGKYASECIVMHTLGLIPAWAGKTAGT